jgi:hypothetical protein
MTFPSVTQKPGPIVLAAALKIAGFTDATHEASVRDACGVLWPSPSELQIAVAITGGEASGHAWIWHQDANGSCDYGVLQINSIHAQWFGAVEAPTQLNWANYAQCAQMAFSLYTSAGRSFKPWNAYTNGGYLAARYQGRSWMDWAEHGVTQMNAQVAALMKSNLALTEFAATAQVASINNDPLVYW